MKTVITYGTFDLFHVGHLRLLERLSNLGDKLIVAVSSDEFNSLKGKKTIIPWEQRAEIVSGLKCVDLVIKESNWEQKKSDIEKYDVDVFAMGDDWKGKFDFLNDIVEVVYLKRTEGISSTELKTAIRDILLRKDDFDKAFAILEQIKNDLS
ncbi:adenylyltransferase/cytidyltransferase family protein [Thiomicrorhabdus sp. 6S2-11]|uniref:Adenylyltransferase/cytidyltransferase family protein n=1 Tax=Thiomicrorhabdus marina TaxID=2818442 RepID=A0ABS3Q1Y5_9GAMM|nr:adenylyltransferase/cytidyltransferase family protein [Thiomicrorhabdus marina]MBO1926351.1 adenylyltransferase/cytidyltransferase family protein [Thiomicrorhabdus marina]